LLKIGILCEAHRAPITNARCCQSKAYGEIKKKQKCNKQKIQCFFREYHIYFTHKVEYIDISESCFLGIFIIRRHLFVFDFADARGGGTSSCSTSGI